MTSLLIPARAAALAVALAVRTAPALAGAWTQPPGEGLAIAVLSYASADRFFDGAGGLTQGAGFTKTEASLYVEYGLREGLTAIAQSTLSDRSVEAPTPDERIGLDYTELGLRARLAQPGAWVISAQGSGRLPGASDASRAAQIGITEPEADVRMLFGRGFALQGYEAYVDLQAGYRVRFGDPANEIRTDLSLGIRPRERWLALGQVFGTFADGSAEGVFTNARTVKLQLSAAYELTERWSAQAGAYATVWGRDAAQENGVFLSVWRSF